MLILLSTAATSFLRKDNGETRVVKLRNQKPQRNEKLGPPDGSDYPQSQDRENKWGRGRSAKPPPPPSPCHCGLGAKGQTAEQGVE